MRKHSKISLILTLALVMIFSLSLVAFSADDDDLIKTLNDKKIKKRAEAAQKLGEKKVVKAVKPLLKMLENDEASNVRIVAAVALYNIGNEKAIPVMKERAEKDENKTVRNVLTGLVKKMEEARLSKK